MKCVNIICAPCIEISQLISFYRRKTVISNELKVIYRSSHRKCSIEKILQNSQENTFVGVSFNKVAGLKICNLDSNTGVFV